MTKVKNNAILQAISGKLGKTHVYREIDGEMHMVNMPKKVPPTEHQREFSERFIQATDYAKAQMLDPEMKKLYQAGITRKKKSAFVVAVSDSLNAPSVNEIKAVDYQGHVGDVIKINATDDFKVVRVRVIIRSSDGAKLEQGEAIQDVKNPRTWTYTATAANPAVAGSTISVTAFDLPDNEGTLETVL